MILVTLGTQDKSFVRLLEAIEDCINKGIIKEKVIVQAGHTKYESENMQIFDLLPKEDYEEIIKTARLLITHGGVSSIFDGINNKIPTIAAARLAKYKEHGNDHQLQIIEEFEKKGFILGLHDFDKLPELLKKIEKFKPKKFISNTNNMINLITDYINEN